MKRVLPTCKLLPLATLASVAMTLAIPGVVREAVSLPIDVEQLHAQSADVHDSAVMDGEDVQPVPPQAETATSSASVSMFGKKEVDSEKFIVMAAPRGLSGDYHLMIVEQLSAEQPCWESVGTAPVEVNPLLLTFDFTGICSRRSDSNAYSIRMDDVDMGLEYSLQVVPQGGELLLMGMSTRDFSAEPIEIGRTNGISGTGFTEIQLNEGWRLTQRTYEEKALGHIYLTSDSSLDSDTTISQK